MVAQSAGFLVKPGNVLFHLLVSKLGSSTWFYTGSIPNLKPIKTIRDFIMPIFTSQIRRSFHNIFKSRFLRRMV
jgi:hypothetical protein